MRVPADPEPRWLLVVGAPPLAAPRVRLRDALKAVREAGRAPDAEPVNHTSGGRGTALEAP